MNLLKIADIDTDRGGYGQLYQYSIPELDISQSEDTLVNFIDHNYEEFILFIKIIDSFNQILFLGDKQDFLRGELWGQTIELKDWRLHGRHIVWNECKEYYEYSRNYLNGYCEIERNRRILGERGFFKDGLADQWWELGSDMDLEYFNSRDDFFALKDYRASWFEYYSRGKLLETFSSIDSDYEEKLMLHRNCGPSSKIKEELSSDEEELKTFKKFFLKDVLKEIKNGGIYRGYYESYFHYQTYLDLTNLPKISIKGSVGTSLDWENLYKYFSKFLDVDYKELNHLEVDLKSISSPYDPHNISLEEIPF